MVRTPNYDNADFEDDTTLLNKDSQVRRRYMKWFNKKRDDFESDVAYDDYLEMVEEIIFNVVNNIDVEATKERVEKYRKQHQLEIGQTQAKRVDESRTEAERVVALERLRTAKLNEIRNQEKEEEEQRKRKLRREQAEQLVLFSKGEEEYNRMVRNRNKAERKKRKREEEALRLAKEQARMDEQAVCIRPSFPHPPPKIIGSANVTQDLRPLERNGHPDPKRMAKAIAAAGFRQIYVYNRAMAEFEQSLSFAEAQANNAVCRV